MDKTLLLEALRKIDMTRPHALGICALVSIGTKRGYLIEEVCDFFYPYYQRWPEYSGDRFYPVPSFDMTARKAFETCNDMFDVATAYGRARCRLLAFLITELEKEIGE